MNIVYDKINIEQNVELDELINHYFGDMDYIYHRGYYIYYVNVCDSNGVKTVAKLFNNTTKEIMYFDSYTKLHTYLKKATYKFDPDVKKMMYVMFNRYINLNVSDLISFLNLEKFAITTNRNDSRSEYLRIGKEMDILYGE